MKLHNAVRLLYPARCIFCGKVLPLNSDACACPHCEARLPQMKLPECLLCGRELMLCGCSELIRPVYDGVAAPFYYSGIIKYAIRDFKFQGRFDFAEYLADRMFFHMLRVYRHLRFNLIIPVPMTEADKRIRGFNQSELICRRLCAKTGIPAAQNVLIKLRHTARQHDLEIADRLINLKDAYRVTYPDIVRGKNILICDDIKTSGSTLSECAHTLKQNGAKTVFAICAAITPAVSNIPPDMFS